MQRQFCWHCDKQTPRTVRLWPNFDVFRTGVPCSLIICYPKSTIYKTIQSWVKQTVERFLQNKNLNPQSNTNLLKLCGIYIMLRTVYAATSSGSLNNELQLLVKVSAANVVCYSCILHLKNHAFKNNYCTGV